MGAHSPLGRYALALVFAANLMGIPRQQDEVTLRFEHRYVSQDLPVTMVSGTPIS